MRLGKLPARHDKRTILFRQVLTDESASFPMALAQDDFVPDVVDMFDNDKIGDCTCASIGYLENVWTRYGARARLLTRDEIVSFYSETTGYTLGDASTDNGADMLQVLRRWRNVGVGVDHRRIDAFVKIEHDNVDHVKSAVALLGGAYVGVMLPTSARVEVDHEQSWSDLTGEIGGWGGHCVSVSRYDRSGVWLRTWGRSQRATWDWWRKYVDECYGVLSPEWQQPNGVDGDRLREYLSQL